MSVSYKKIFKKVAVILLICVILYLFILAAISIYISSNKEKIITLLEDKIEQSVNGKVSISSIDISVWSSFPKIAVHLKNVSVSDSLYHLPILQMREISARAGLIDLIGNETDISSIQLSNGFIHIFTDSAGYNNSYLLTGKKNNNSAADKKGKKIFIENVLLKKVQLLNESVKAEKKFDIRINFLDADIDKKNDSLLKINLEEDCLIKGLGFDLSRGSYLNDQTIKASWKMLLNTTNPSFSFDKTEAEINDHVFNIEGGFNFRDSGSLLLNVSTENLDFAQAKELVPANISRVLNFFKIAKPINVLASINGSLAPRTTPLVNVIWSVKHNELSTNAVSFSDCGFNGLFTNRVNKDSGLTDENSEILLTNFSGYLGAIKVFSKNIAVTNLTTPKLQFAMQSDCSFAQLDSTLSLKTVRFVSGNASLRILYSGPVINNISIIDKLSLDLLLKNGVVQYLPRNLEFTNFNGDVLLSQNNLSGGNFSCDVKQTHFQVKVSGDKLSSLSDSVQGKANIYCSVNSSSCNLADFITLFSPRTTVASKSITNGSFAGSAFQLDNLLSNSNLHADISADKIYLDKFAASDIKAKLLFEQDDWEIQNASFKQSNGNFNFEAKVYFVNNDYHEATASFKISNADVKKVFYSFNDFGQSGISSQNLRGALNSSGNISVDINNSGKILKSTMNGNVSFSIKKGALVNYAPIAQIKSSVLKDRDLSNIEFAELKNTFKIAKSDVYIPRMEIESSAITCFVEGIYGLKNNTDISIQIPLSNLKKRDENYTPKNQGSNTKAGPSVYFRAQPDKSGQIKLTLDVFKKFRSDDFKEMKKDK